jgi:hypothetical protein
MRRHSEAEGYEAGPHPRDGSLAPPRAERPTSPNPLATRRERWLIQLDRGELRLVEGDDQLVELLRAGRITGATQVYEVAANPRALGQIPQLERLLIGAMASEPPVRRERRSPERSLLSEELAVLDRPLEDDIEYYDEVPMRRWPKRLAVACALAAVTIVVIVRYPLAAQHLARSLGIPQLTRFKSPLQTATAPRQGVPVAPPPAATDTSQAKDSVVVEPLPATALTAPAARSRSETEANPSPASTGNGEALLARDSARGASAPENSRQSTRRHLSRHHHAPSRR